MSDDRSARWALPMLQPGQSQKEMFHNEALALIDLIAQTSVVAFDVDTPPSAPHEGDCWIVGDAPTGIWAGRAKNLAGWTSGGWRFVEAGEGMAVWVASDMLVARFTQGGWTLGDVTASQVRIGGNVVVGDRQGAIADPSGGSVIDVQARSTLETLLAALRAHGLIEN